MIHYLIVFFLLFRSSFRFELAESLTLPRWFLIDLLFMNQIPSRRIIIYYLFFSLVQYTIYLKYAYYLPGILFLWVFDSFHQSVDHFTRWWIFFENFIVNISMPFGSYWSIVLVNACLLDCLLIFFWFCRFHIDKNRRQIFEKYVYFTAIEKNDEWCLHRSYVQCLLFITLYGQKPVLKPVWWTNTTCSIVGIVSHCTCNKWHHSS